MILSATFEARKSLHSCKGNQSREQHARNKPARASDTTIQLRRQLRLRGHKARFSHDSIDAATRTSSVMPAAGLIESRVCGSVAAPVVHDTHAAKRFFISGMVQGVGYRYFAQRTALRLGLAGYVKNLHDGRVEVYAIGDENALKQLRAELERGPRAAVVSSVDEEAAAIDLKFSHGFTVEFDSR
jgi:acylphosphatase